MVCFARLGGARRSKKFENLWVQEAVGTAAQDPSGGGGFKSAHRAFKLGDEAVPVLRHATEQHRFASSPMGTRARHGAGGSGVDMDCSPCGGSTAKRTIAHQSVHE